jgi:hypothetical protein
VKGFVMTPQDAKRIREMLDQAYAAGDSIEDTLRRIAKEMPHITSNDISEVANTRAEKSELDASVLAAKAKASEEIANILLEAEQMSGRPGLTQAETFQVLRLHADQGDARARELLVDLSRAAGMVDL